MDWILNQINKKEDNGGWTVLKIKKIDDAKFGKHPVGKFAFTIKTQ